MPDPKTLERPAARKAPRQDRSRETVRLIVEAAARILEEGGFALFSTNAVAARAGVSVGSLYQYFPRKEALVGALILRETSSLIADARSARTVPGGRGAMSALIRAAILHQFRRPALARLLDFEEARLPLDADLLRVGERFRAIVEDVLSRPDLPGQADPAAAARDVTAIIKGMVDGAGIHGETDERALGERVERAVMGYLGCPTTTT